MSTHVGSVRSFVLGVPATAGRRWAARCSCGALATTDAWSDALDFMTDHLQLNARPRAVWSAARPFPDLRRAECWRPVVVGPNGHNGNGQHGNAQNGDAQNGNGRTPRIVIFHRRVVRLVSTAVRVALGLPLAARG
jgi:hypothetical protein